MLAKIARDRQVRALMSASRALFLRATHPGSMRYHGVSIPFGESAALRGVRKLVIDDLYERDEIRALEALVRPDDVVLEAGAGLGVVTSFVARRLNDSRKHHAFEANADVIGTVKKVAHANGVQPEIHHAAVAGNDGEITFYVDKSVLSSSPKDRGRNATAVTVPSVSLGRLLKEVCPTVVIFDVEGGEEQFVDTRWPICVRVICCEVHPHVIGDEIVSALVRSILGQGFLLRVDLCGRRALAFERAPSTT